MKLPSLTYFARVKSSRHGHTGVVTGVEFMDLIDPDDLDWMECQQPPLTPVERTEVFVRIRCDDGGEARVPISAITICKRRKQDTPV